MKQGNISKNRRGNLHSQSSDTETDTHSWKYTVFKSLLESQQPHLKLHQTVLSSGLKLRKPKKNNLQDFINCIKKNHKCIKWYVWKFIWACSKFASHLKILLSTLTFHDKSTSVVHVHVPHTISYKRNILPVPGFASFFWHSKLIQSH